MEKIKILIVDDENLIREGLKLMLSTFDDIEVVATAENGYKALEVCKSQDIDIVLMDIRMKDCDGVMGTRLIKEQFTKIKVIILTTFNDKEYIKCSFKLWGFWIYVKRQLSSCNIRRSKSCLYGKYGSASRSCR